MFSDALPFASNYVCELSDELHRRYAGRSLGKTQQGWLSFCLTGLLLTGSLCWAAFERTGLGSYRVGALSWMFRSSKLPWSGLLQASVSLLLRWHKLPQGVLVADDSDHRRAKSTTCIYGAHKVFDKKTSGYFNGQCLIFLILVTDKATFPVGVRFYRPDPAQRAWRQENARLIKAGIQAADRPKAPALNPDYPGKAEMALSLIEEFCTNHPDFIVKAVLADAFFGTRTFMDAACAKAKCTQTISQLHADQLVVFRGRKMSVQAYVEKHSGTLQRVCVRGGETLDMWVSSARLMVQAHGRKRFVIAVRNKDEAEYRYLVASDMAWRTQDIVQCYTLRWLVEVFFEDWKLHEGWANLAKQPGKDGAVRGVTLSLLLDHALLIHPEQRARLEKREPACTVGRLKRAAHAEAFLQLVQKILQATDSGQRLEQLVEKLKQLFPLAPSKKHMSDRDLGRQEPTPSLRYRAAAANASTMAEGSASA